MLPRLRLLGAILLGGALYTYGATSEVAWLFLFAYLIWATVIVSYAYARWNAAGIRSELHLHGVESGADSPVPDLPETIFRDAPLPAPVFEGDSARVQLALRTSGGQRGPARFTAAVAGTVLEAGTGLVPASGWSVERTIGPLRRGLLEAGDLVLEVGDPLGFFRQRRRRKGSEVAAVLPLFASLGGTLQVREVEASLTATRPGPGNELFGVREYRTGDSLRRIHWKTSARRGELVVREFEPPGMRLLGLLLEAAPPSRGAADQLARLAASEAWDCIRSGGRVTVWAAGREALPSERGRSLWAVLDWLARYPDLPADPAGAAPLTHEVVGFMAGEGGGVGFELARLRDRGVAVRAWVVGDGSVDVPHRRTGLAWPL